MERFSMLCHPWKKAISAENALLQFLSNLSPSLLGVGPICNLRRPLHSRIAARRADWHCETPLIAVGSLASPLCWLHQIFRRPFMINRACYRVAAARNQRSHETLIRYPPTTRGDAEIQLDPQTDIVFRPRALRNMGAGCGRKQTLARPPVFWSRQSAPYNGKGRRPLHWNNSVFIISDCFPPRRRVRDVTT